jgi:hypothetical protein
MRARTHAALIGTGALVLAVCAARAPAAAPAAPAVVSPDCAQIAALGPYVPDPFTPDKTQMWAAALTGRITCG